MTERPVAGMLTTDLRTEIDTRQARGETEQTSARLQDLMREYTNRLMQD